MDADLYAQLDVESLTELPPYLGLLSPDEQELPDLSWRRPVFAPFDDHSNALEVDVGPSKEPHESGLTDETTKELGHVNDDYGVSYSDLTEDEIIRSLLEDKNDDGLSKEAHESGLTDETTQELEHVNDDYGVSYSDLTEHEIIRSLLEDKNDLTDDGLSREISDFMDNHFMDNPSRDSTIDTLDQSMEIETTDNVGTLPASVPKVSLSAKSKLNKKRGHFELQDDPETKRMKNEIYDGPLPKSKDNKIRPDKANYNRMRKEINDNLVQKLNKGLLLKSKQFYKKLPWKQLKREDLINWPKDVPLERSSPQGRQSLTKLYSNLNRIDFTKEFLDLFAKSNVHKRRPNNQSNDPKYVRMIKEIQDNLVQKLNKGLLLKSIQVYKKLPWNQLKRDDLINWPKYVRFDRINRQGRESLTNLYSYLDRIDFTKEFLDRYASTKEDQQPVKKVLIDKINLHLLQKFNEATQSDQKRIPWEKLAKGDLVNWPFRLTNPSRFSLKTLKKLHENLHSIYFKPSALKDSQL